MGSVVKSVFGGDEAKPAEPLKGAQFQPFSYTSLYGSAKGEKDGTSFNFSQNLDPQLKQLYGQSLDQASPALSQYFNKLQGADETPFSYDQSMEQATDDYFAQQQQTLNPVFAQQRQQLQSDLFGSGRMGLMLAGDAAGAGGGGMVNPDAFGLARGQAQALQQAYGESRQAAMGEQAQGYGQAAGTYGINQQAFQQQLANLQAGFGTALGTAQEIGGMESGLINQAAVLENMVRQSQAASANAGANLADAGTPASGGILGSVLAGGAERIGSMDFGGMFGGAGGTTGGAGGTTGGGGGSMKTADYAKAALQIGATMFSDTRLKENIFKTGYENGHNTYTWDWNDLAVSLGISDQPTNGVMAQEVMVNSPEAVSINPDNGYYMVNYNLLGVER